MAICKKLDADKGGDRIVATGYGRVCVDYADKIVTEITCHGRGGSQLFGTDCTIIDVGGQDTKVITVSGGTVTDFLMNDKIPGNYGWPLRGYHGRIIRLS